MASRNGASTPAGCPSRVPKLLADLSVCVEVRTPDQVAGIAWNEYYSAAVVQVGAKRACQGSLLADAKAC